MIRFVWLMLLAVHTGAAGVWWWLMPGGFPSSSTEFWVNQVAPPLVIAMLLLALFARGRFSEAILPPILAMIPVFWMAFGISSRITFPESFASLWNLGFIGGAVLAGLWVRQFRFQVRPLWLTPALAVVAACAGWAAPGTQQAPEPATAPAGAALDAAPARAGDHRMVRLTHDAQLHPIDGRVVVRRDKLVLNVEPMLSFADRSPDRCWTALAPPEEDTATTRKLLSQVRDGTGWKLFYKDEDASELEVTTHGGAIELDARSRLAHPIFSHANSFAELTIQGQHELSVSFSPLPERRIEIPAATAPARFAYVDAQGTFHVVQASQRQVGPFTEIAAAPMGRRDPLVLTIYDGGKAAFSVTLQDWAAQASTQLSPTAGWGVPVNAIELVSGTQAGISRALVSVSLAATSIGRGTQTVGHAPGVYRDRITVSLPPQ